MILPQDKRENAFCMKNITNLRTEIVFRQTRGLNELFFVYVAARRFLGAFFRDKFDDTLLDFFIFTECESFFEFLRE